MKPLRMHRLATSELDKAMRRYNRKVANLGLMLHDEVNAALGRIEENPAIGAQYHLPGFRYLKVHKFPYVIFYAEGSQVIGIFAIAHGRRRQGYWHRRTKRA